MFNAGIRGVRFCLERGVRMLVFLCAEYRGGDIFLVSERWPVDDYMRHGTILALSAQTCLLPFNEDFPIRTISKYLIRMKTVGTALGLLLSIAAAVLVVGQVGALQVTGQAATTGALATFFQTPMFLLLLILAFVAVMAAVFVGSRLL